MIEGLPLPNQSRVLIDVQMMLSLELLKDTIGHRAGVTT